MVKLFLLFAPQSNGFTVQKEKKRFFQLLSGLRLLKKFFHKNDNRHILIVLKMCFFFLI